MLSKEVCLEFVGSNYQLSDVLGITVITVYNSPNCSLVFHTALGTINTQAALHVNLNLKY